MRMTQHPRFRRARSFTWPPGTTTRRPTRAIPTRISGSATDRTVDEMAHAWMKVYYLSDEEYAAYQAEHKKPNSTQNQQ